MASFTLYLDPPDTDTFCDLDEIDMDILEQMANHYDRQMEKWHMPTNISLGVTFTDFDYDEVERYESTDNGNLHIGYTLTANCLRYATALKENDDALKVNATRMVKKCLTALSLFMAAPNGGLGINPDTGKWYPGTLARFVAAPDEKLIHPWMFGEHYKHFNGTGDYKNYRVRLYTSRDELGGFYIGTAAVLKFITDDDEDSEWCVDRVRLIVTQMIEGFRNTNWLLLGGNGNPTGSDLNPVLEGSTWQLTLLRIGAAADPDKYLSLYHYCASKILTAGSAKMGSVSNAIGGYYAFSFGLCVELALIWLEEDPALRYHYIKNFEESFYSIVRYHRNNFHNLGHLIFMTMLTKEQRTQFENPDYSEKDIKWDVIDNMWRFYTSGWAEGIRNYNLTQRPHSTRETSLNPEMREKLRQPYLKKWRDFFENNLFGPLFSWIEFEFDFKEEDEQYLLPLTVSEYGIHHWMWEHNKFDDEGGEPYGNGLTQAAPNSYICIYWMMRYYDII